VKASGLRWVCLMLLVAVPWAERAWALPFLTALAPSERYPRERGRRHTSLTVWARQFLLVVRRWWPHRPLVAGAASTAAPLDFLAACRSWPTPVTAVPVSGWTRPSMSRRPRAARGGAGARGSRAGASPRSPPSPPTRRRGGPR
jgi:hypothetical protein